MTSACEKRAGPLKDAHFVSYVDLAKAEGAEVGVGLLHRRLDRLAKHFLHKLTNVRPHLFHRLRGHRHTFIQILISTQQIKEVHVI